MRRQSQREVEAAAQRRLELLLRELDQSGLSRLEDSGEPEDTADLQAEHVDPGEPEQGELHREERDVGSGLPAPARVARPGRHARPGRGQLAGGLGERLSGAVADRLPETFRGRAGLQTGPALLVVALVVAAVLVGVVVLARSRPQSRPVPTPGQVAPAAAPQASTAPGGPRTGGVTGTPESRTSGGEVTVDVTGKVRRPGVRTLPAGSRVVDAVKRAGGARPGADLSGLNLARVLVDGEQVVVGKPQVPGGIAAGVASGAAAPTGALVNLNTATAEQLDTLPGVGPVTAQKILQWRSDHGSFSSVDELMEVDGIGEKTFADLAPLVTL